MDLNKRFKSKDEERKKYYDERDRILYKLYCLQRDLDNINDLIRDYQEIGAYEARKKILNEIDLEHWELSKVNGLIQEYFERR